MDKVERKDLWDYLDTSDLLEIVSSLKEGNPYGLDTDGYEGYAEALDDILHAAKLDAMGANLTATKEHIESWVGHVALNSSDEGYCTAVADVVESISQLISDRH